MKTSVQSLLAIWLVQYGVRVSADTTGWRVSSNRTDNVIEGCIFEHNKPWPGLKLLDPKDGLPFVNIRGSFQKTTSPLESMPVYTLEQPQSTSNNIFDIRLKDSYLALFDDGTLAFAPTSSNGPVPRGLQRKSYITSIFSISCDGTVNLSIPDTSAASFARSNNTDHTYIQHTRSTTDHFNTHSIHKRAPHIQFIKRTISATDIENGSLSSFSFLAGPALISDRHQRGSAARCQKQVPFGLTAVVKPGARDTYANGCGAENGMKVPDLRFTECCDTHDLCYDDCSATWETCNDNFRDCNHMACTKSYPNPSPNETASDWGLTRWGCHVLADTYADFVDSALGRWSFNLSSEERCMCRCPDQTFDCGKYCMIDCHDINEDAVLSISV